MFADECPEHVRGVVQLQEGETVDMYKSEDAFYRADINPPSAAEICNFDGEELHQTLGTALAGELAEGTTAAGSFEDIERKQVLRPVLAKPCPGQEPSALRPHQQEQGPCHSRGRPRGHHRTQREGRTLLHQGSEEGVLRGGWQQGPLDL